MLIFYYLKISLNVLISILVQKLQECVLHGPPKGKKKHSNMLPDTGMALPRHIMFTRPGDKKADSNGTAACETVALEEKANANEQDAVKERLVSCRSCSSKSKPWMKHQTQFCHGIFGEG
jgi:hypothetical protein